MLVRLLCTVAIIVTLAACSPTKEPTTSLLTEPAPIPVSALWDKNELIVTNFTPKDVYFVAFPVRILPVILWTSVTNPRTGLMVASRSAVRFPRERFTANTPDTLEFSWWHLGRKLNDSLYNADSVRGFRCILNFTMAGFILPRSQ